MTNFEKYKEQIIKYVTEYNESIALVNGKLQMCGDTDCEDCSFNTTDCKATMLGWLYLEPRIAITPKQKQFLDVLEEGTLNKGDVGVCFIVNGVALRNDAFAYELGLDFKQLECGSYDIAELRKCEVQE